MHGSTCACNGCGGNGMMEHIGRKNRHKLLKFVVIMIFMFMAFCIGVQFGEIKGALGITPFSHSKQMMRSNYSGTQMMYSNPNGWQFAPEMNQ